MGQYCQCLIRGSVGNMQIYIVYVYILKWANIADIDKDISQFK